MLLSDRSSIVVAVAVLPDTVAITVTVLPLATLLIESLPRSTLVLELTV